jgi:hypothetical protein
MNGWRSASAWSCPSFGEDSGRTYDRESSFDVRESGEVSMDIRISGLVTLLRRPFVTLRDVI